MNNERVEAEDVEVDGNEENIMFDQMDLNFSGTYRFYIDVSI